MKSWPKVKLGEVIICPYLGLSTLIGPTIYHFNQHLALFTLFDYAYVALIWTFTGEKSRQLLR